MYTILLYTIMLILLIPILYRLYRSYNCSYRGRDDLSVTVARTLTLRITFRIAFIIQKSVNSRPKNCMSPEVHADEEFHED